MKVLKLGWEFPPVFAGGVGMVCYELTRALSNSDNINVTYVMPFGPEDITYDNLRVLITNNLHKDVDIKLVPTLLSAYDTATTYEERHYEVVTKKSSKEDYTKDTARKLYGSTLLHEVYRFSAQVSEILKSESFDVIHAHDWTTFPAAIQARNETGKPLVVHVHITEFDKSGGKHADPNIYAIERSGMQEADRLIAISNFVKNTIVTNYGIDPQKITVIHNAANTMEDTFYEHKVLGSKVVLFAGRITHQKGPLQFVQSARKVLEHNPDVTFIMAGTGDMLHECVDTAAQLGIADKFIFHGFYTRAEAEKLFSMSHVFVMPSLSEPFGLVPMEAMSKGTPAIISKQSGCSEVLRNAFKVDFWDTDEMANKILALLEYPELRSFMGENGKDEVRNMTWDKPASQIIQLYREVTGQRW